MSLKIDRRLQGNRIRSNARQQRQCHRCLQHGEHRPGWGPHGRFRQVVAPSQTLSDKEYQMLRDVSLQIIRALKNRRRLQCPVGIGSVLIRLLHHRSEPARQPFFGFGE